MKFPATAAVATTLVLSFFATDAQAGIVLFGDGDTIGEICYLPPNAPVVREAAEDQRQGRFGLGSTPTKVGYKYYRFHVFWMPLWTWGGEYVAYSGEGLKWYRPLGTDPAEVSLKTGVPVSALAVSWSYRHPWGLYLFGLGVCAEIAVDWWRRRRKATSAVSGQRAVHRHLDPVTPLGHDGNGGVWVR